MPTSLPSVSPDSLVSQPSTEALPADVKSLLAQKRGSTDFQKSLKNAKARGHESDKAAAERAGEEAVQGSLTTSRRPAAAPKESEAGVETEADAAGTDEAGIQNVATDSSNGAPLNPGVAQNSGRAARSAASAVAQENANLAKSVVRSCIKALLTRSDAEGVLNQPGTESLAGLKAGLEATDGAAETEESGNTDPSTTPPSDAAAAQALSIAAQAAAVASTAAPVETNAKTGSEKTAAGEGENPAVAGKASSSASRGKPQSKGIALDDSFKPVPEQAFSLENAATARSAALTSASTEAQKASLAAAAEGELDPTALEGKNAASVSAAVEAGEKFAVRSEFPGRVGTSGGNTPNGVRKNDVLTVDNKLFKKPYQNLGTDTANQGETSMYTLRQPADFLARFTAPVSELRADSAGRLETPAPAVSESHAAKAAQAVSDIHELATGLPSDHKQSVELRFDFGQHERLSVKVEYKDGEVRTTFRTDSHDLRDALSTAWRAQGVSAERTVKMADPVFTAAPVEQKNFSMNGGNDSRQQQRTFEQPQTPSSFGGSGFRTSSAPVPTPSPAVAVASDRHLQAFA